MIGIGDKKPPKRTTEEILAAGRARAQLAKANMAAEAEKNAAEAKQITAQLPKWPDAVRGVPNAVLRSALFGAVRRGQRAFQQGIEKASIDGVTVIHTGPQLDQADLDVWEHCLHLARTNVLGKRIQFTAGGFLTAIGRSTGNTQHEWLKGSLRRLMTSLVELEDGKKTYAGQLIHYWGRDKETGQNVLEINPSIAVLYGSDGWTSIEFEIRRALKKQPLAQWLHGFYCTHARPYPFKVATIHGLCGSEAKQMFSFRQELRQALTKLAEVTGWTWEIDDADLLHVAKTGTASQGRNQLKKATKKHGIAPMQARHSAYAGTA